MSIKKYFDEKLGKECFKVQILRRSKGAGPKVSARRRILGIETYAEALRVESKLVIEAEHFLRVCVVVNCMRSNGIPSTSITV